MLAAVFGAAAPVGRAALLQFLVELGRRSFAVIVVLASWCPVSGIRAGQDRWAQTALVFLSASVGLAVPAVLPWTAAPAAAPLSMLGHVHLWAAPALLGALCLKAFFDFRDADRAGRPWRKHAGAGAVEKTTSGADPCAEDGGFAHIHRPYDPFSGLTRSDGGGAASGSGEVFGNVQPWEMYGSVEPLPPAPPKTSWSSLSASVLAPLISTLVLAMAEARQNAGLEQLQASRMGALLGLAASAAVAVVIGFVLERQLSDRRFLLLAFVALGALCFATAGRAAAQAVASAASVGRQVVVSFLTMSATPRS
mmetsp:Transcript_32895/g.94453  ORF Transcript_32895/g.94453 Transcript_32895/m.94453 type:complete len:309 (-) Transcript_32895:236-1162(-)